MGQLASFISWPLYAKDRCLFTGGGGDYVGLYYYFELMNET